MERAEISGWGRNFLHRRMVKFIGLLEEFAPDEKPRPEGPPTLWELFPTITSWDIPGLTLEVEENTQREGKILHYYSIEKARMLRIIIQKHDSQSDNYLSPFYCKERTGYKLRPRTDMCVGLYLLLTNWLNFCAEQLAAMAEAEECARSRAREAQQTQRLMRRVLVGQKGLLQGSPLRGSPAFAPTDPQGAATEVTPASKDESANSPEGAGRNRAYSARGWPAECYLPAGQP